MDYSKINQTELDFNVENITSKVNLYTGRNKCIIPLINIGAGNFSISTYLVYNSLFYKFNNIKIGFNNGFKLNIHQYVLKYDTSYNLDGFNTNDYVYIDSDFNIHRFVYYKTVNENIFYYDDNGSGLKLVIVKDDGYRIVSPTNDKLRFDIFGHLIQITSGVYYKITKQILYNSNKEIISIYDHRKPNRSICINYFNNDFSIYSNNNRVSDFDAFDKKFIFKFDSNNNLIKILKKAKNVYDYIKMFYDNNKLSLIVNARTKLGLKFKYDNNKVIKILNGLYSEHYRTTNGLVNYVENEYGDYLIDSKKSNVTYFDINDKIQASYDFLYKTSSTIFTNDKEISHEYFFNKKGFTTGSLEIDNEKTTDKKTYYKTLFKTGGYRLDGGDAVNVIAINNVNGKKCLGSRTNDFIFDTDVYRFTNIFKNYPNGNESMYKYRRNFVFSFWIGFQCNFNDKLPIDIYCIVNDNDEEKVYKIGKTKIDAIRYGMLQYVSIPVFINLPKDSYYEKIKKFKIVLDTKTIVTCYFYDVRIDFGSRNDVIIDCVSLVNDMKWLDVSSPDSIKVSYPFSQDIITEEDIFNTYRSMFFKSHNIFNNYDSDTSTFDLYLKNGTEVIQVNDLTLIDKDNNEHKLRINGAVPNFHTLEEQRIGKNQYQRTQKQNAFYKCPDRNVYFIETKTSTGVYKEDQTVGDDNSALNYSYVYVDGLERGNRDDHCVKKQNYYDSYGNLTKTRIYNEKKEGKEINTFYAYAMTDDKLREIPKYVTENGVLKEIQYDDLYFNKTNSKVGKNKTKCSYDDFGEKVTEVSSYSNETITTTSQSSYYGKKPVTSSSYGSNSSSSTSINNTKNTKSFVYDVNTDRLKKVSDNNGAIYEFDYDEFGNIQTIYENNTSRKEVFKKYYNRNNTCNLKGTKLNHCDIVKTKNANKTTRYQMTILDKYNRLKYQKNDDEIFEEVPKDVTFYYQDDVATFNESKELAKVSKIVDKYSNSTINYKYDENNLLVGYNKTSDHNSLDITQLTSDTYTYKLGSDDSYYCIEKTNDSTQLILNPRVKSIKCYTKKEKYKDSNDGNIYECSYEYDDIGRLNQKITKSNIYSFTENIDYDNTKSLIKLKNQKFNDVTVSGNIFYYFLLDGKNCSAKDCKNNESILYDDSNNISTITVDSTYLSKFEIGGGDMVDNNLSFKTNEQLKITYKYNYRNQIIKEINNKLAEINYKYDDNGNLLEVYPKEFYKVDTSKMVTENNNPDFVKYSQLICKRFTYDKGKKITCNSKNIVYNDNGNITSYDNHNYHYDDRLLLDKITSDNNEINIKYDYNRIRTSKIVKKSNSNDEAHYYYYDGTKLLGEDIVIGSSTKKIRYFYDVTGICGMNYDGINCRFIKDIQGNVSKIMYGIYTLCEYIYDAWGHCVIHEFDFNGEYYVNRNKEKLKEIIQNNPIRWKGHYYDIDLNAYYVEGRYYSLDILEYLDATPIEALYESIFDGFLLNRHVITEDNPVSFEDNDYSFETNTEFHPDPEYEPSKDETWWHVNWKKVVKWTLFIIAILLTLIVLCICPASGLAMFLAGLKAAISGAIIGGLMGGIISAISGDNFWDGALKGAIDGAINGFTTGAICWFIGNVGNLQCFKEGTLVKTCEGNKPIEDIKVGDLVYSYNEQTKTNELKEVTQLFRNETYEWYHIYVNDEEIVCTASHPFYIVNKGYVKAEDLEINDSVMLSSGDNVNITNIYIEKLSTPEVTYNFEVQDNHNYYVSESGILVHNECWGTTRSKYWKQEATELKGDGITYNIKEDGNLARMLKGKAPKGIDGKPVELHHVFGREKDVLVQITRTAHMAKGIGFHSIYGFKNFPDITKLAEFSSLIV